MFEGVIEGPKGAVRGERPIGAAKQPACGGCCTPSLTVYTDAPGGQMHSTMQATGTCPCFFGGMSEMCCDQHFEVRDPEGTDIGRVIKRHPRDMESAAVEFFTDADCYTLDFPESMTPAEKARLIGSLLLVDYMFFERDHDAFSCEDNQCMLNLCNMYCCGCICPCKIDISGREKSRD